MTASVYRPNGGGAEPARPPFKSASEGVVGLSTHDAAATRKARSPTVDHSVRAVAPERISKWGGGTSMAQSAGKFFVMPLHFFGCALYEYNSRFGERFCYAHWGSTVWFVSCLLLFDSR